MTKCLISLANVYVFWDIFYSVWQGDHIAEIEYEFGFDFSLNFGFGSEYQFCLILRFNNRILMSIYFLCQLTFVLVLDYSFFGCSER